MGKDILFEIGLEELPARFVNQAEQQLREHTVNWLQDLRISFQSIQSFSTPRRLAVLVCNVSDSQQSLTVEVKGPAEKIAKDEHGEWTKAAIGFTKGQGKSTDDIYIKKIKEVPYIHVEKHKEGEATEQLLPSFKKVIGSLQFASHMRWGEEAIRFARPIRWLVGLYGSDIVPFEIAHVQSGNVTYGHRFLGEKITLKNPRGYEQQLQHNYVIADSEQRKNRIKQDIIALENKFGYHVPIDEDLLNEVTNLVEYPTVFKGGLHPKYLDLPSEVLIISMREHQRYFPVYSLEGDLLPYFVSVRNGNDHGIEKVIKGNERVLHARLADAQFFYEEDSQHSIDYYQEKLNHVVFQEKIGTIGEKVKRVQQLASQLTDRLSLDAETAKKISRAAEICKFDLTTDMVIEFTELQGVIGEKYALKFGENEEVAKAIKEHYLPNHADGELPASLIGSVVSVADKLDTIVSCIYAGFIPTSSQDPYGLRRQAIGILKILKEREWDISVKELFEMPFALYAELDNHDIDVDEVRHRIEEFIKYRVTFLLKERKIEPDVIEAILKKQIDNLPYLMNKASVLSSKRDDDSFKNTQEALVRVLNLAKKGKGIPVNPDWFETDSERKLYDLYLQVREKYDEINENRDAYGALAEISQLAVPIHEFFSENMVMADDEQVRNNRLGLINKIADLIINYADFSEVEWKQRF